MSTHAHHAKAHDEAEPVAAAAPAAPTGVAKCKAGDKVTVIGDHPKHGVKAVVEFVRERKLDTDPFAYACVSADGKHSFDAKEDELEAVKK